MNSTDYESMLLQSISWNNIDIIASISLSIITGILVYLIYKQIKHQKKEFHFQTRLVSVNMMYDLIKEINDLKFIKKTTVDKVIEYYETSKSPDFAKEELPSLYKLYRKLDHMSIITRQLEIDLGIIDDWFDDFIISLCGENMIQYMAENFKQHFSFNSFNNLKNLSIDLQNYRN
ncbi:MAG: hypothetical protein R1F52_05140 [Candidatus Nitrosoabyssus spongiisocia]|nr:MAG: hypothetical protein R1F52_05140 [Nitrosopumilaceae archaeon AB1(1)]